MSIDFTKPVQTRDGRKVTIYRTDAPGVYRVHGHIEGNIFPTAWTQEGHDSGTSDRDLINVPEPKRTVKWLADSADLLCTTCGAKSSVYTRVRCNRPNCPTQTASGGES